MMNVLAIVLAICFVIMLASCGTQEPSSRIELPKVVLTSQTDSVSVWLVYGTNAPDTCFTDIYPEFEHVGNHYVGHGYGYVPVHKAVYRYGKPSPKQLTEESELAVAVLEQLQHSIADGDFAAYCYELQLDECDPYNILKWLDEEIIPAWK